MNDMAALRASFMRLLRCFRDVCDSLRVPWYLWGGTCLGAVRSGGFIPWDDDIDACVMPESVDTLMRAKWPAGFTFGPSFSPAMFLLSLDGTTMVNLPDEKWRNRVARGLGPAGVHLDVFPMFNVPESVDEGRRFIRRLHSGSSGFDKYDELRGRTGRVSSLLCQDYHVPVHAFGRGTPTPFEGESLPVPDDADLVLRTMYGPDYMTPQEWGGHHGQFVDFDHDWTEYAAGKRSFPDLRRLPKNGIFVAR